MTLTKRQERLYEALIDIDPCYVAEALERDKPVVGLWCRRLAVVAAVLALLIAGAFWLPSGKAEPLFFVSVMANDELNVTVTMTAQMAEDLPEDLADAWQDREVFCVEIRMEGAPPEYLAASSVTVEYEGRNVTKSATWEQLSIQVPEDSSDGTLCRIYGWARDMSEDKLNFTVTVSNTTDGAETILCSQPFEAFYKANSDNHLIVNHILTVDGEYSVTMEIMSTEELVDVICEDENAPPFGLFASHDNYVRYTENYYEGVLAVLRTRDNAASVMIKKLQDLEKEAEKEPQSTDNIFGVYAICTILNDEYYKKQLSKEESQWFETFNLFELYE